MDSPQNVLFVEDEMAIRTVLEHYMGKSDFGYLPVTNPSSALAMLDSEKVDIVVSDISFPGIKHEEVFGFFKEVLSRGIPVVIYSGAGWEGELPDLGGSVTILDKIVTHPELIQELISILESRKEVPEPVDEKELERLVNPDWHVKTPIEKWLLRNDKTPRSDHIREQILATSMKQQLRSLFQQEMSGQGVPSKRELNAMMGEYLGLSRKLEKSRKERLRKMLPKKKPVPN